MRRRASRFAALLDDAAAGRPLPAGDPDVALVRLARGLGDGPRTGAPAEFREALGTRLRAVAAVQGVGAPEAVPDTGGGRRRGLRPVLVPALTGAAAVAVAAAGVVVVAQDSLPGDVLHPVETAVDRAFLARADDGTDAGVARLLLATERVTEARAVLDRSGDADAAAAAVADADDLVDAGAQRLVEADALEDPGAVDLLLGWTEQQTDLLQQVGAAGPGDAQVDVSASVERVRELRTLAIAASGSVAQDFGSA